MYSSELLISAPVIAALEVSLAVLMFCIRLPRRSSFVVRMVVTFAVVSVICALLTWIGFIRFPELTERWSFQSLIAAYSITLLCSVAAVMYCFEVSVWTALFCSTAGYITQNAGVATAELLLVGMGVVHAPVENELTRALIAFLALIAVYVVVYFFVVAPLEQRGLLIVENRMMLGVLVLVFLVNIVLGMVNRTLATYGVPLFIVFVLRAVHLALCAFLLVVEIELLYSKRLQTEINTMQRVRAEEQRQFRLSHDTISAVNARVSEIREQIAKLEDSDIALDKQTLEALEKDVGVYDAVVKTGNATLDIILAEKSLICEQNNITLTCIADGEALAFVEAADLYSLLGNALENAIDAVRAIDDEDRRAIGLTVRKIGSGSAVVINVDNYYTGELNFIDGIPQTTKGSTLVHGYGMRSMKECVERYGGTLRTSVDADVFHLNAILSPTGDSSVRINPLAAAAATAPVHKENTTLTKLRKRVGSRQ